ncbi:MAG TPA: hypothetical protein VK738_21000 [Terriglobales bacterium]|jgi:CheY-like chemotaxis protein|nr:hypothetical protein [Terriglobales bacterium]
MKKSICFVDDDPDEIERFRKYMGERYIIGAATMLEDALDQLQKQHVRKPDLFLLDLYYGPHTEEKKRAAIAAADDELSAMEAHLRALLLDAGQSPKEGFKLAERAHSKYSATPRIFFSRKAFLQDALEAQERGLAILEKPDPDDNDHGTTSKERYDAAFGRYSEEIARKLDRIVSQNTWWARYRQKIEGFSTGFFFFLSKIGWDLWKGSAHGAAVSVWIVSVAILALAWFTKRP